MTPPGKLANQLKKAAASNQTEIAKLLGDFNKTFEEVHVPATATPPIDADAPLDIKIGCDKEHKVVLMDFGKPITWLTMSVEQCDGVVQLLIRNMAKLGHGFVSHLDRGPTTPDNQNA